MTNDTTPKRYTLEEMLDMADRLEHHMQPDNEAPADMLRQAAADRERAEQLEKALAVGVKFHRSLMSDWAVQRPETDTTLGLSDSFEKVYMPEWPEVEHKADAALGGKDD